MKDNLALPQESAAKVRILHDIIHKAHVRSGSPLHGHAGQAHPAPQLHHLFQRRMRSSRRCTGLRALTSDFEEQAKCFRQLDLR